MNLEDILNRENLEENFQKEDGSIDQFIATVKTAIKPGRKLNINVEADEKGRVRYSIN